MSRYTLEEALEEAELLSTPEGCEKLLERAGLAGSSYLVDGAVNLSVLDYSETQKVLLEIADKAIAIDGKELRSVYAQDVRAKTKRYTAPQSFTRKDWWERSLREFLKWQERPRICDDTVERRFERLQSNRELTEVPVWAQNPDNILLLASHVCGVELLYFPEYEFDPDKKVWKMGNQVVLHSRMLKASRMADAGLMYWHGYVVPDNTLLAEMTDEAIKVLLHRMKRDGDQFFLNEEFPVLEFTSRAWRFFGEDVSVFNMGHTHKLRQLMELHAVPILQKECRQDPTGYFNFLDLRNDEVRDLLMLLYLRYSKKLFDDVFPSKHST